MRNEYQSKLLQESYIRVTHSSGLTIYIYPSVESSSISAYLAVNYGAADSVIKDKGKKKKLPEGIAHLIEHFIFEDSAENKTLFSSTGAIANAYCAYDRTVYYFSCFDKYKEILRILLKSVTNPIFSTKLLNSVKGVVIQEIKLYQNNPSWLLDMNLNKCLYHSHAIKSDIAGTEKSVNDIGLEILTKAYSVAYKPENMVLVVMGNCEEESIIQVVDEYFKKTSIEAELELLCDEKEPETVKEHLAVCEANNIYTAMFAIGFKDMLLDGSQSFYNTLLDEFIAGMLIGEITPTFQDLYTNGYINSSLIHENLFSRNCIVNKIRGESENPNNAIDIINKAIDDKKRNGVDSSLFEICKKEMIGRLIYYFDDMSILANYLILSHFNGINVYTLLDYIRNVNVDQVNSRLQKAFNPEMSALSIVRPMQ